MFCRNCGTENDDSAKFCRSCGQPIVPADQLEQPAPQETADAESETAATDIAQESAAGAQQAQDQTYTQVPPPPAGQPPYGQPVPPQGAPVPPPGQPYPGGPIQPKKPNSTSSIVALILGIVSVVCCCFGIIPLGCGIAAIILAASERKKDTATSMTTAALVLGIIGVCFAVISFIWFIASGALGGLMAAARYGNLSDYLNDPSHWSDWNDYYSSSYYWS